MDLLNIHEEDTRLLLKCYIISLFIPGIAKPILMIHGEQGSAKTTFQELIKMLVDPSILKTLSFSKDFNVLIQILSHNYITYFDNISSIPDWISDLFCRAVTGSAFSKRQLYTDDDDIIYDFKRSIGFNGINLGASKADLLDREILIQLERIPKEKRKKLEEIWDEFDQNKPKLLGYIFDILVEVLRFKKEYEIQFPQGYNRMADFEEYAEIISRCMGYPEGQFLRVYQYNIGLQIDEAIEASPLSAAIRIFIMEIKEWQGTTTQLLDELNGIAENDLKINITNNSSWVKSANQLSRRINEIKTNLREKGIIIERFKDKDSKRIIKIRMIPTVSSYRPETENQQQNEKLITADRFDDTHQVSSYKYSTIKEQKNNSERYDDRDDSLHIKVSEHLAKGKTLKCYRCKDIECPSLETYNRHCFSRHPGEPMYPELSLIKMMGLEPKGNPWE